MSTNELNSTDLPSLESGSTPASIETTIAAPTVAATELAAAPAEPAKPNPFELMGLVPALVQAVADMGFTEPTEVQKRAVPLAMGTQKNAANQSNYTDLMVSSQTGSGKTAAFLLPVLDTLVRAYEDGKAAERAAYEQQVADALAQGLAAPKKPKRKNPLNRRFEPAVPGALVLCPTRELAMQVASDAIDLMRHCRGVRIANVIGGLPYPKQIAQLQNASLVVATPGRLLDLQRSGQLILDKVQFLVVDEADRMLDLGFSEDLAAINQLTEQRQQTMMFSATFAPRIQQLGMRVMHDGGKHVQRIEVASAQEKHANITQKLFWADNSQHKRELLDTWLRDTSIDQAIVFASTQIECDALAEDLQQANFSAVALHGALNQGLRNRRLSALRDGRVQILVATDVAARGIDVPTITHVFNYGLPMKSEDYTHRIGRTGRAGRDGLAVTFAEFKDRRKIFDIEQFTRQELEIDVLPGLEPQQRITAWRPTPTGGKGGRGGERRGGGFGGDRRGGFGGDRRGGGFGGDRRGGGFGSDRRAEGFGGGRSEGFGGRGGDRFESRQGHGGEQRFGGGERFEGGRGQRQERGDRGAFSQERAVFSPDRGAPTRKSFAGKDGQRDFAPRGGRAGDQWEGRERRNDRSNAPAGRGNGERFANSRSDSRGGHGGFGNKPAGGGQGRGGSRTPSRNY
ncbi:DEAD/DEAH box helicase [Lampropedia aestuarii]|uniref:DEAD/DEAH box helicase n=1 Tax=Lampropedia aestuarii TaxID=2562762 RepID=UPI0024692F79|nr:DEAD/DEAH box helicase [Lampropedia aestuarii]MDH5856088.1 DEAD/DEAH box helicase [Lampropedia aestuarii]